MYPQKKLTKAERDRLEEEEFMNSPLPKWKYGVPHPLYKDLDYGDITRLAGLIKNGAGKQIDRNYLSNLLTGVKDWTPMAGDRGNTKREVFWHLKKFVWALKKSGVQPPCPSKKAKNKTNMRNNAAGQSKRAEHDGL